MDLAVGAKRVFIAMEHATRDGKPRLVRECSLPVTATGVVKLVVTNLGLFEPAGGRLILREIAPGVSPEEVVAQTSAPLKFADPLPVVRVTRH
jgi:3-oxoacid CoA-transferase B subunit